MTINLAIPTSWAELTQEQLAFLLKTMVRATRRNAGRGFRSEEDFSANIFAQIATECIFRWNGVKVITPFSDRWLLAYDSPDNKKIEFEMSVMDLTPAAMAMAWMRSLPESPVRLERIDGSDAVAADLDDGFSFDDFLSCESLWQVYAAAQNEECLRRMAAILYRNDKLKLKEHEVLSIFYWWTGLKSLCNRRYPNFFQPAPEGAQAPEVTEDTLRRSMDSQIRALTKGDITKEETILSLPCHRALTELDALAREYEELNRKYPTKK